MHYHFKSGKITRKQNYFIHDVKGDISNMDNVATQNFPKVLIEAIQRQKNISRIFYLSKGASEYLYIISHKRRDTEIFEIVCYGETKIEDFLEKIFNTPSEQLTYYQKSSLKKLNLFIKKILKDYNLESIVVGGIKITCENVDTFFSIIH